MKKIIPGTLLLLAFLLSYCGKTSQNVKKEVTTTPTHSVKVIEKMGEKPNWTEMSDGTGLQDGKKVLYFVGYGESQTKTGAKDAAELNAITYAAQAVKTNATKQVARAWEIIGTGDNQTKEQVMKGLEAISSKNVDVSGLMKGNVWWRQIVKPNFSNGNFSGYSKPFYEYYVRYSLDYDKYTVLRDKAITDSITIKEEKEKVVEEIKKEDEKKIEDFTGYWIGLQTQPSGKGTDTQYYYELSLKQEGSKVTGKSYTSGSKNKDDQFFVIFELEGEVVDGKLLFVEKKIFKDNPNPSSKWYFTQAELTLGTNSVNGSWWSDTSGTGQIRKNKEVADDGTVQFTRQSTPVKLKL